MSEYDYSNELIEQCVKAQQRAEVKIAALEAAMQELGKERMVLIKRRDGILLTMSQLQVHAPRNWCHFCKKNAPKSWDHLPKCLHFEDDPDE